MWGGKLVKRWVHRGLDRDRTSWCPLAYLMPWKRVRPQDKDSKGKEGCFAAGTR